MDVFDLFAKLSLDTSEYEKGIDSAKKSSGDLKKSLAVAGAATAGAGAAVFAFADKVSKNADEIDKMSQKLGLSAEAYQEWSYVLELNGTSIDKMQGGMKTLVNTLDDAKNGSADAIEKFERIGLSLEDIQNMSQEELFGTVVEQFQGMEDTAERAALANDLLGKSATELRPLFNSTTEATQEQIQALHDMGGVMSDQAVKDGAAFQDALTSLKKAFAGVANTLGEKLMPYITDFMDGITEFVKKGGIEKIIKWFKRLAPVITAAASAMVAYKAASSIGAVIDALTKATKTQSAAQAILNTVMNANPFVLAATAIAGVTAALVTLYVTNEDFRNFIKACWEGIKDIIGGVIDAIKYVIQGWIDFIKNIPEIFKFVWDKITDGVETAWNGIKDFFGTILDGIKLLFETIFGGIGDFVSGVWNGIKSAAEFVWGTISDVIGGAIDGVVTFVTDFWNGLLEIWDNITGWISDIATAFWDMIQSAWEWGANLAREFWDGVKSGAKNLYDVIMGNEETSTAIESDRNLKGASFRGRNAMQTANGASSDTNVTVYIGQEQVDDIVVNNEQRRNYRSGGR